MNRQILILLLVLVGCSHRTPQEEVWREARAFGYLEARRLVPEVLLSPATAEFDMSEVECEEQSSLQLQDGCFYRRFKVAGTVDSQNVFGALVRTSWEMTLLRDAGEFSIAKVRVGNETVYEDEKIFSRIATSATVEVEADELGANDMADSALPREQLIQEISGKPGDNAGSEFRSKIHSSPPTDPEKLAAGKLFLARKLIEKGEIEAARRWLNEIIQKFPDTEAAIEARSIEKGL